MRSIKYIIAALIAAGLTASSYATVTVAWGTTEDTYLSDAGGVADDASQLATNDLVEIGTWANFPSSITASNLASELSSFEVFGSGSINEPPGAFDWVTANTAGATFAGKQIVMIVYNQTSSTYIPGTTQVAIFYEAGTNNPSWIMPADGPGALTAIDVGDLMVDGGDSSDTLAAGANILWGGTAYDIPNGWALIDTKAVPESSTSSTWISPASGKWEAATNWSSGSAPSTNDAADLMTNAITKTVTIDATTVLSNAINGCMTINSLYIAGTANSNNTLSLTNAGTNTPLQVLGTDIALTLDTNGAMVVNNSAVVAVNGSAQLYVGNTGGNASLIITNGGAVYSGYGNMGNGSSSSNNAVLVAGPGSVWSNSVVYVGESGAGNRLVISNSGAVYASGGGLGYYSGHNTAVVTGPGSVWSNAGSLTVGINGVGNSLVISNGGAMYDLAGTLGDDAGSSNNTAVVTGVGSVWYSQTYLDVGRSGSGNLLTIAGGSVIATNVVVGVANSASNNELTVTGGSLFVTNALGNAALVVSQAGGEDMVVLYGGAITANQLVLTNGPNSFFKFSSGTLTSGGTFVTNNQLFAVGVAGGAATFQLNGGVHSFANGIEISSNATLTGCGTINGNVTVDQGSTVQANCGGNLNFTDTVTNNGTVTASNGTVLNFYGPVVNNLLIDATGGSVHFFSTLTGSGSVLLSPTNSWIDGSGKWETATNWSSGVAPSLADSADSIGNAGNNTVTIDATTSSNFPNTLTISNLIVAAPGPMTNTLLLSNAGTNVPLVVFTSVSVSHHGTMILTNSALQVGAPSGGALTVDGQLTLDSGTILVSSNLLVGLSNPLSLMTIWGGALYVTNAAHNAVSEVRYGTLVLTGGVYFTDSLLITNTGAAFLNDGGTFTITGLAQVDQGTQTVASGTTQLSSNLVVGTSANSTGTVNVTGGQLIVTNAPITIGSLGVGSMTVSNGTVSTTGVDIGAGTNSQGTLTLQDGSTMTVSSNLTAGSAAGATGTVSVSGGQLVVSNGTLGVGNDGTATNGFGVGTVTVSNGTVLANQILLGSSVGGQGQLTIQPNGLVSLVGTDALLIANDLTVDGGDVEIVNGIIYCGQSHPGAMTMNTGTANCQITYVGYDSQGTLTMVAGQMTVSSLLEIGFASGSTGSVWMSGGQLTATALATTIGNQGVGQMSISNGIAAMADVFVGNSSNPGTLTLAGGTLTINSLVLLNPGSQFNFTGGWLNALGITNSNGQLLTLGDGVTPITLSLLGGISSLGNGLMISANATFTGFGTINGNLVNYGRLFPGSGTLSFLGTVTNYATILTAVGGTTDFQRPVVNYGLIVTNSSVHFLGGLVNNGAVLTETDVQISSITQSENNIVIQIPSVTGALYQLQVTPSLNPATWTNLGASQGGTGGMLTFTDLGGTANPARFYCIEISVP